MKHKHMRLPLGALFLFILILVSGCGGKTPDAPAKSTQTQTINAEDFDFTVTFIDVGQADAALIECEGHSMLIDGGNRDDSDRLYTILEDRGISHLDLVIATHAHEDHIGGIPGALSYASAGTILTPVVSYDSNTFENFSRYAKESGADVVIPEVGDVYSLGSAQVTILGLNASEETNDTSIVAKITYGDTSFLFTGDAERLSEETILASGADLSADVLKVGHHGSDSSTTYPFLREIMPEYAVISVGRDNQYGHPSDETLSRLRDAGAVTYRTDVNGDITIVSDGTSVAVAAAVKKSAPDTEETVYVVNTNSRKFHLPSCGSVQNISGQNRMDYEGTRADLLAEGYEPCGNCRP